ncbi:MAG: hypothetical protein ACKVWV_12265 [Planctomycetota bacterium]
MTNQCTEIEARLVDEIFRRLAGDLEMVTDRKVAVQSVDIGRAKRRPAGAGSVHVSFKIALATAANVEHGCMLVPLPDALSLASYLLMLGDDVVQARRNETTPDPALKDALMEVGKFVADAIDAALRGVGIEQIRSRSEGCQGVRANVRPAFAYREGSDLVVGLARVQVHTWPACTMILMIPALAETSALAA